MRIFIHSSSGADKDQVEPLAQNKNKRSLRKRVFFWKNVFTFYAGPELNVSSIKPPLLFLFSMFTHVHKFSRKSILGRAFYGNLQNKQIFLF